MENVTFNNLRRRGPAAFLTAGFTALLLALTPAAASTTNTFPLTWSGKPSRLYQIQTAATLGANWQLQTKVLVISTAIETNTFFPATNRTFYRLSVNPQ